MVALQLAASLAVRERPAALEGAPIPDVETQDVEIQDAAIRDAETPAEPRREVEPADERAVPLTGDESERQIPEWAGSLPLATAPPAGLREAPRPR
jgi:hypothetical protein